MQLPHAHPTTTTRSLEVHLKKTHPSASNRKYLLAKLLHVYDSPRLIRPVDFGHLCGPGAAWKIVSIAASAPPHFGVPNKAWVMQQFVLPQQQDSLYPDVPSPKLSVPRGDHFETSMS